MNIQGLFRYQTFIRSELVERIEELEVERDRYRDALKDIILLAEDFEEIGVHLISITVRANEALEGEK